MPDITNYYKLNKPKNSEKVNISVLNANMDTLDTNLKSLSDKLDLVEDNISVKDDFITREKLASTLSGYAKKTDIPTDYLTYKDIPEWSMQDSKPSYTAEEIGADSKGTANTFVSDHNTSTTSHPDIREIINGLTKRLNTLADSDDETLDQMSEIISYIKENKELIDSVTTSKVNISDIVDNLETNVTTKPLAASQGVIIKDLIAQLENTSNKKNKTIDEHILNSTIHFSAEEKVVLQDVNNKKHSHNNQSVIDSITQTILDKIESTEYGAQKNIQADWNATSGDSYIKNKPIIPQFTSELINDNGYITKEYTHPSYTPYKSGLYKITIDDSGHVTNVIEVTKADIVSLGIPASDTNTHYSSFNVIGSSTSTVDIQSSLSNGNVYLNSIENGVVTSSHRIIGKGIIAVTTDEKSNIVIDSSNAENSLNYETEDIDFTIYNTE